MNVEFQKDITELLKREIVPAIGCTEPVAVALCAAKARELLGRLPQKTTVRLSANVLKNAMGVGIPGTGGMIGLPVAIALGVIGGKTRYSLEVLKDITEEDLCAAKTMIEGGNIEVRLKKGDVDRLYIETVCTAGDSEATAIIAGMHTDFVYLSRNGEVLYDARRPSRDDPEKQPVPLSMRRVYDYAMNAPLKDISFILESARLNKNAAEVSFDNSFGHCLGKIIGSGKKGDLMGDNILAEILSYTSAACDARMAGSSVPVMSNSGSGNQGIAATLPVVIYGERNGCSREQSIRALTLSHLTVIYIKQSLGRLSALCGCVVASTGATCGIIHLMGGDYQRIEYGVKNMIANLTGMICDGAKPSCSLKLSSGAATAVLSAMLAMEGKTVTHYEGIIEQDVDKCIRNLTSIGSEGMDSTDRMVLEIMTGKQ